MTMASFSALHMTVPSHLQAIPAGLDYGREAASCDVTGGNHARAGVAPGRSRACSPGRFWTADAGQLTPDRLWAEAERRISAPEG